VTASRNVVYRYHDGTKHHFDRFARSLGYLDWASQPHPFRRFAGAPALDLFSAPPGASDLADLLRHSLALSAWKRFRDARWSLRVNPSSGNLHPTEAYVLCGPGAGLAAAPGLYHYAPDRHALEQRCLFDAAAWTRATSDPPGLVLVALASVHWREAWKYGERAFRYCQHDLGHALGAVALAAPLAGWRALPLPAWSHRAIARLTGIDRDDDYVDAEREDPGCLLALTRTEVPEGIWAESDVLLDAVREGRWAGRASQLSEDHVQWSFIDEVAAATEDPGRALPRRAPPVAVGPSAPASATRRLMLHRRSALAFDGRSALALPSFLAMLAAAMPGPGAPWSALWWRPRVHLAIFVHRVEGLDPGTYLLARRADALPALEAALGRAHLWERAHDELPLVRLARGDCRGLARRLSCDQDIAADGFFSLAMLAEFDASLEAEGASFYRHLFWETGVVGQVLYLEAEAGGGRATGIGCFYDDPVHEALGLRDHAFQSLYHFAVGRPVEDARLTTEPGYAREGAG
jgi:SagB-type dehydrogenase family enzyme